MRAEIAAEGISTAGDERKLALSDSLRRVAEGLLDVCGLKVRVGGDHADRPTPASLRCRY